MPQTEEISILDVITFLDAVGYEFYRSQLVGNQCESMRTRWQRMQNPQPGDLVLETSSCPMRLRGGKMPPHVASVTGIGILERTAREPIAVDEWDEAEDGPKPTEEVFYIRRLDNETIDSPWGNNVFRWTNASFVVLIPKGRMAGLRQGVNPVKNLKDTLKELYEEVPRNWSHIRCTEKTYEAIRNGAVMRVLNMPTSSLQDLQLVVDEAIKRDDILALYDRYHQFVRSVEFSQSCEWRTFQCGTGEMGTLYWSKDANLDKFPEMTPVPIDPEVDRIDFYIKTADGEYIPWTPTEAQKQMISFLGLPVSAGKYASVRQRQPGSDSSSTVATDKRP